jgi:glutathione S-transferase
MKLWSGTLSPFSAKVRIVMAEKGIDAEIAEIPWSRANLWGPKPEAFLRVSPKGEVPALDVEGTGIADSTIINEYLEDAYPRVPMMPGDPIARAQCRMWEDRADSFMASKITVLIQEVFMKSDDADRDLAAVAAIHQDFAEYLGDLDGRLTRREWLCEEYSIADVATWICLAFAQTLDIDLAGYPGVSAWNQRVLTRPVVANELNSIMEAAAAA